MATYYVRPDGNDANTGLGSTASTAWRTVQYALTNAILTTGVNYIYIAPGVYRESVTLNITPTVSNTLVILGDPTAAQFTGVIQGVVRLTNFVTDNANPASAFVFLSNSKSYFTLENIYIDGYRTGDIIDNGLVAIKSCTDVTVRKMVVVNTSQGSFDAACYISSAASNTNIVVERSYFMAQAALVINLPSSGTVYNPQITIRNCHALGNYVGIMITANGAAAATSNGVNVYNCTIYGVQRCIWFNSTNTSTPSTLYNSLIMGFGPTCIGVVLPATNVLTENFNKIRSSVTASNISTFGANTTTAGSFGIDHNYSRIVGLPNLSALQSYYLSPNANAGTLTGAPSTDIYGVAWTGPNPDIGAGTYATPGNIGVYNPSVRNESTLQITAGSTSRSLYLYLGATGLTATTTGLQAYYTKEDAAPVSIPLVVQTTTGAWVSGGFAEVSAANQPGVYRLDIPNAAISAGYTQTVVTVRGASGTNGAVVVIQEPPILGSQVRMGPFTVQADGVLTDERLKLFKGSIHSIDFKKVDQYGTGVDGTGTVVTANAYNSAGFLVDSYPCTAKYAEDGRYSFAIDATVTNVVGMYTINISRQIGSEINVFGRMKLEVLSP